MEGLTILVYAITLLPAFACIAFFYWRYIWFFRNPSRNIPQGEHILSPADGTVVYTRSVPAERPIISTKGRRPFCISDIVREDLRGEKLLIGVFMSPFNVHYNRAPISGQVAFMRHHPARFKNHHMSSMHWRSFLKWFPLYENSPHVLDNERLVTKLSGHFKNAPVSCYVVQIGGGSVRGIESRLSEGDEIEKGHIFGMIKVGSQVDVVINRLKSMTVKVKPGEKVRAGETILVD